MKQLFITFLILYFIIACGGNKITSANSSFSYSSDFSLKSITVSDEQKILEDVGNFPENTYYLIYLPIKGNTNLTKISYLDTNRINKLWCMLIRGGLNGDGRQWGIRDGDNVHYDIRNGNYYYFDEDMNIIHAGGYANKVMMKKFVGAVIVDYSSNANEGPGNWWAPNFVNGKPNRPTSGPGAVGGGLHTYVGMLTGPVAGVMKPRSIQTRGVGVETIIGTTLGFCPMEADADMLGTWSIGGLYESVLNYSGRSYNNGRFTDKGYADYGKYYFIDFMAGEYDGWGQGTLSVVVLNAGYKKNNNTEFGFDQYYSTDLDYRQNISRRAHRKYIGQDPKSYTVKLDIRRNHSYYGGQPDEWTGYINHMRFVSHWAPYDWQR